MPIESFLENYPVLLVTPICAVMFLSARQDYKSRGSISPFNFSLWLGAVVPLGWACALANRPWQLASMVAVLVIYCGSVLNLLLRRHRK